MVLRVRKRLSSKDIKKEFIKIDHFMERVRKSTLENGCWDYVGSRLKKNGYGEYLSSINGYIFCVLAHRISYLIFKGDLDFSGKLVIDHICRNKRCVNPDHLRQVSHRVNARENSSGPQYENSIKTHCKRGHPLSGDNLILIGERRMCSTCSAMVINRWHKNNKERAVSIYRERREKGIHPSQTQEYKEKSKERSRKYRELIKKTRVLK